MKFTIFLLIFALSSCSKKKEKHHPDPKAIAYNDKIVPLISFIDNLDSSKKALAFLDTATAIDNDYFLGHYNKIMFLNALKQNNRAVETVNQLIRLAPNRYDLYETGGVFFIKLRDTTNARIFFSKSLTLCNNILDTMSKENDNYPLVSSFKAIDLLMLKRRDEGNKILIELYRTESQEEEKKSILLYMNKSPEELAELITTNPNGT